MEFEWDEDKAASNLEKHGIAFEVGMLVFLDAARTDTRNDGDEDEERWQTTGLVRGEEVTVIYTIRMPAIRLISVRRATSRERRDYWNDKG